MPAIGKIGMTNVGRVDDIELPQFSRYLISGQTLDTSGAPLAGCTVNVFESLSGLLRGTTISDANGNYAVEITGDRSLTFFANAYRPGSPDVAGTTLNTLLAV